MANAAQIVAAFRDVAATKSLSDEEMTDLVKDGMLAGLARIYGPTVQAEIDLDDTGLQPSGLRPHEVSWVRLCLASFLSTVVVVVGSWRRAVRDRVDRRRGSHARTRAGA